MKFASSSTRTPSSVTVLNRASDMDTLNSPGSNAGTLNRPASLVVTAGKLRFTSGEQSVDVEAGSVVVVPIGVPHTFSNPFDVPAVMLNTFTPDLYIQYFRDLSTLPVGPQGLLDPADIGRTMARYATDVVRPPA